MSVAVLVAGIVGSVALAESTSHTALHESNQRFKTTSAEMASTLQLAITHEEDLIVSAGGFVSGDPGASNAQFGQWADSVQALQRYPELIGLSHSVLVPASQLATFAAQAVRDPTGPLAADGTFQVIPAGSRAFYCLTLGVQGRPGSPALPAGNDFCAGANGGAFLAVRDSGTAIYAPITVANTQELGITTPIYRGGTVPTTVAARRAAFLGWGGMAIVPTVLLDQALQGHPGTAVTLSYRSGTQSASFRAGKAPTRAQRATTGLSNGWTVVTAGAVSSGGVLSDQTALWLMLGGIALSVLSAGFLLLLTTSRARALRQVRDKTGELRHQALHDALTGLPNRALITDRSEQLLARNRRNHTRGAALYVDLDGFKNINDTQGHAAGDLLLQAVAARFKATLRDADTIGRMGGDEFIVLVDGGTLHVGPELVATRLLEVMRQPFELAGAPTPITITASVGISKGDCATPGEMLRDADVALYKAKAAGKNCYAVFHQEMETELQNRNQLEFDLLGALGDHQFRLVYQPIYNLDDLTMVGAEALIRWQHPILGEIQPDEFIPLLEASGQIIEVGRWVLAEACAQMAAWRNQGSDLIVSVNVSGRQLDRDSIVDHVRDALEASRLKPDALTLEVTETALVHNVTATAARLRELKALGVQIAIDDFGTGYSSLAYLQQFPVDSLKIDRTFTESITGSAESDAIVHTLVQLGKDLGLKTLAEGVETPGQIDHLRDEQVNQVQGFLLAKPLTPGKFAAQLLDPVHPKTKPAP